MTHQPEPILRRVKCSERLPEKAMENYLTVSSRGTETARFFNGTRFETAYYEGEITHWYEPITAVVLTVKEYNELKEKS